MGQEAGGTRAVRVAAVQMRSELGQIDANLRHATDLVDGAARAGASLVILPELASSGYSMSRHLWDAAETRQGRTVQWVQDTARRFGVYLGTGFVEADGEDFFNSYALAAPDGQLAGVVRKTMAEEGIFRCATGSHVVPTRLGRLGVGICADNHFAPMVQRMRAEDVDLMLMPHAVPGAFKVGGLVSEADVASLRAKLAGLAPLYARLLGVPALFANQVGPRGPERWSGIMGSLMSPEQFRFIGLSTVANLDGTIRAQLDDAREGSAVADVTLNPTRKARVQPVIYGRYGGGWLHAAASGNLPRDVLCAVDARIGRLSYRISARRRWMARAHPPG